MNNDYNTGLNLLFGISHLCGFIGAYNVELFLLYLYIVGIITEMGSFMYALLRYIEDPNYQAIGIFNQEPQVTF